MNPGISTKKDLAGNITHVTIDVREHQQAIVVLEEMGLLDLDLSTADNVDHISLEQLRAQTKEHLRKIWPR